MPETDRDSGIIVRSGNEGDLDSVAAIQAAGVEAAAWPVKDYLAYDLRVAALNGAVVGFACFRAVAEGEHEILNLAVAPEFRRRGVARALLRSFLKGYRGSLFLEVRESNAAARNLYKSLSFQDVGIRKEYYETPTGAAIVMKYHSC